MSASTVEGWLNGYHLPYYEPLEIHSEQECQEARAEYKKLQTSGPPGKFGLLNWQRIAWYARIFELAEAIEIYDVTKGTA